MSTNVKSEGVRQCRELSVCHYIFLPWDQSLMQCVADRALVLLTDRSLWQWALWRRPSLCGYLGEMWVVHLTATDGKITASSASVSSDLFNSKKRVIWQRKSYAWISFSFRAWACLKHKFLFYFKCAGGKWLFWSWLDTMGPAFILLCEIVVFQALWNKHNVCNGAMCVIQFAQKMWSCVERVSVETVCFSVQLVMNWKSINNFYLQ